MNANREPRYHSRRWKALRKLALVRDLYRCQVAPDCPNHANVADHITAVYPGMSDAEFFDPANLRAACMRHNTARGVAARLEREVAGVEEPRRSRYSVGGGSAFFRGPTAQHWPLANPPARGETRRSSSLFSVKRVARAGS